MATQELSESDTLIASLKSDRDHLQAEIKSLETALEKAQGEFEREKAQLSAYDEELKDLEALAKLKAETLADNRLELQNIAHETDRLAKEKQGMLKIIKELEEEHDWIVDQRQ